MAKLVPEADWLQDVIHPDELHAWDPEAGPCCTPDRFKLNLAGTPRDDWNISASRVFTDHFLAANPGSYQDTWEVRQMVLNKSQAYIKSLIKLYRQQRVGDDVTARNKLAHRRRERKAAVRCFHPCCPCGPKYHTSQLYHRRRDITFVYPQMEPQRRMLEDLGVDGMSSDEEVKTPEGKRYLVLAPRWRAPALTFWLRIFDSLYLHHRNREEHGDQRGCLPRRREGSTRESTSRKFVPGLPLNAYKAEWLEQQLDVPNMVHPSAEHPYGHDPQLAQYVFMLLIFSTSLTSYQRLVLNPYR